jgi:putative SOS response-associated peptidase YedK
MLKVNADDYPLMHLFQAPDEEKRMVVVLQDTDVDKWLRAAPGDALAFLREYPRSCSQPGRSPFQRGQQIARRHPRSSSQCAHLREV